MFMVNESRLVLSTTMEPPDPPSSRGFQHVEHNATDQRLSVRLYAPYKNTSQLLKPPRNFFHDTSRASTKEVGDSIIE